MKIPNNYVTNSILIMILLILSFSKILSQSTEISNKDLHDMSLDELFSLSVSTAGKKPENIKEIPASVIVINRQEIESAGYQTFTELLSNVTGFYLIDDYYWLGSLNFGVRGFFSTGPMNNIIILVNGVNQLSDKYSDYPDVKINVPIEAIDRIEIIRGPMSVMYGPGAFFGAINIITNGIENETPLSMASLTYGSMNTKRAFARYSANADNLKFTINAGYSDTEGIDRPFSEMTSDLSVLTEVGLDSNATTAGQRNDNRKYFGLNLGYNDFQADISIVETVKDIFDGQPNLPRGSEMTTHAMNFSAFYQIRFADNLDSKFKVGYYNHSHVLDYEVFFPSYYEIDAQNTSSYDAEINIFYEPKQNIDITFGLYRRTVLDLIQISDFGYYGPEYGEGEIGLPDGETYSTHAAFTQLNWKPIENIEIVGGIRLDHLDDYPILYSRGEKRPDDSIDHRITKQAVYSPENNGFSMTSRLALLYKIGQNILKLMWGQATKQPSYSENYRQFAGNHPFLEAADISTLEINALIDMAKNLKMSVGGYYNGLNNLISTTNILDQETGEWDIFSYNSGKTATSGIEIGLLYKNPDCINLNASFVYQKSNDKRKGYENIKPGYSPDILANISACYEIYDDIKIAIVGKFIDDMETEWKTKTIPEEGYRIGEKIDAFYVMDLNFRFDNILEKGIFVNLKIGNLTGKDIRYPATSSNSWANKGTLGYSRTFYISSGYKF